MKYIKISSFPFISYYIEKFLPKATYSGAGKKLCHLLYSIDSSERIEHIKAVLESILHNKADISIIDESRIPERVKEQMDSTTHTAASFFMNTDFVKLSLLSSDSMQMKQKERINDIRELSFRSFAQQEEPKDFRNREDCKQYIHKHINIAEFLCIKNPSSFPSVIESDNATATIYSYGQHNQKYKYICNRQTRDIFDVVQELAGCSFCDAIDYVCKAYNLHYDYGGSETPAGTDGRRNFK